MIKIIVFMLLGVAIAFLSKFNKAKSKPEFEWKIFIKNEWVLAVLNLLSGILVVYGLNLHENPITMNGNDVTFLIGGLMGMSGHVIWKAISEALNKNILTKFGSNKK